MDANWKNQLSQEERKLWEKLLGEATLKSIMEHCKFPEKKTGQDSVTALFLENCRSRNTLYTSDWLKDKCFFRFYEPVLGFAVQLLNENCIQWMSFGEDIREKFVILLFSRLENASVRTLVADMREKKDQGKLLGESPEKQYEYYVESFLKNGKYCETLLEKHPVLIQILQGMIIDYQTFLCDFSKHLDEDLKMLSQKFWDGRMPQTVTDVQPGMSDAHQGGRSVVKVIWDYKYTLYYKPRSVKNDVVYQDLYQWVGSSCNEIIKKYEVMDMGSHGWCMPVILGDCNDTAQICTYFRKLGIQLCICYLFYVKDLHFENMMACEDDPVFVDMETFPGLPMLKNVSNIQEIAREKISDSVMITGALPVTVWNFDGHGIRMGALGSEGKQKLPVKVPVIIRGKTSDMEVVLRHPEMEVQGNLPKLHGKTIYPADYVESLIQGFNRAYRFILDHKQQLLNKARCAFDLNSRVLLRNTQQYFMYLQTASSPFFLSALWRQQLFFMNLYNSSYVPEKWKDAVIQYESAAMLQRDIPYFYMNGRKDSLFDSFGNEYEHYYTLSAMEAFQKRLEAMNISDCGFQERLIRLSMATLPEAAKHLMNTWAVKPQWDLCAENSKVRMDSRKYMEGALTIGKILMDFAIADSARKEILWPALSYFGFDEMNWRLDIQNMYLYDGLAGTGLFLSVLGWLTQDIEIIRSFQWIRGQLFDYTESVLKDGCPEGTPVGIFNGEASLIYVYLLWYHMFKDPFYLIYAQKHSTVVEKIYKEDKKWDVLSGNAGAMVAWLHLYDVTNDMKYLDLAKDAGKCLMACALKQKQGAGWLAAGEKRALAGMSHGNSGFILAFARLYAKTQDQEIAQLIRQLMTYEDALFNPETGNWRDLRQLPQDRVKTEAQVNAAAADNGNDAVAWCHGAPGILLARLEMHRNCPDLEAEQVETDISMAISKLSQDIYRESFCLCHGNCGNAWMAMTGIKTLEKSGQYCGLEEQWQTLKMHMDSLNQTAFWDVMERLETGELLPQEKYNPGFMTGLSGIGYAMLREIDPELPDVLALRMHPY